MKKGFRRLARVLLIVLGLLTGLVVLHLGLAWWRDTPGGPPPPAAGQADVSRFSQALPREVIAAARELAPAERHLGDLVRQAAAKGQHIALAGARHSMGGHTMADDALVVDLTPLDFIHPPVRTGGGAEITVGGGARWSQVLPVLQAQGLAVQVMQSNNDFTVGGSLAVNCHGWQHGRPPIAATVVSLRIITPDGQVVVCDEQHDPALMRHVLGGYGLFGIITQATLRVVPDEHYRRETAYVTPATYWETFERMTAAPGAGMAYGRINVAPLGFLESGTVNVLRLSGESPPKERPTGLMPGLKRLVFRGAVGSAFGKQLREWGELAGGETGGGWRSVIQSEPAADFGLHTQDSAEILHEYFVPVKRLPDFIKAIRPLFATHRSIDLLNITVRDVRPDTITSLPYAREHVFGLVMLFHLELGAESDARMRAFTQDMIEAALACGGTYYLPYRPHATPAQFHRAHPAAAAFFQEKLRRDPQRIFRNQFWDAYGPPR